LDAGASVPEQAVPQAKDGHGGKVKDAEDAKKILTGAMIP
jgi:hypothetical protein